jgi:hypothetical protein
MAREHAAGKPCLAFRDHEANGKTARVAFPRAVGPQEKSDAAHRHPLPQNKQPDWRGEVN